MGLIKHGVLCLRSEEKETNELRLYLPTASQWALTWNNVFLSLRLASVEVRMRRTEREKTHHITPSRAPEGQSKANSSRKIIRTEGSRRLTDVKHIPSFFQPFFSLFTSFFFPGFWNPSVNTYWGVFTIVVMVVGEGANSADHRRLPLAWVIWLCDYLHSWSGVYIRTHVLNCKSRFVPVCVSQI